MPDRLVQLGHSPAFRRMGSAIGVSLPPTLQRADGAWSTHPLKDDAIVVMLAPGGTLGPAIASTLAPAGAEPAVLGDLSPFEDAGAAWSRPPTAAPQQPVAETRIDAVVFDASGIHDVDGMQTLHRWLQPWIRRVRRRVVILSRPAHRFTDPETRACQRALDGFTRSLAREMGRKGATANLIAVDPGAADRLPPLLRWLLSKRSAYVSGQPFLVTANVAAPPDRMAHPLTGKVALITGAAQGIGAATARAMAAEGARVIIVDRPEAKAAAEAVASDVNGVTCLVDVTAEDAPTAVADAVRSQWGGIDVLVHNAGVTRDKTLGGMSADMWDLVMDVNLRALLRLNDALLPLMNDHGRVIALSSIGGIAGNVGQTNYAATKAGVIGLIEALAPQLAPSGTTVNAVAPGFIETRMTAAIPVATREVARRLCNLSQGGQPEDVAAAIVFLSSPGAAGLTGHVLRVCGGNLLGA